MINLRIFNMVAYYVWILYKVYSQILFIYKLKFFQYLLIKVFGQETKYELSYNYSK